AAVHFELLREAVLSRLRPGFHAAEHVDVDIADHDDRRLVPSLVAIGQLVSNLLISSLRQCPAREASGISPKRFRATSKRPPVYRRLEIFMPHLFNVLRRTLIAAP